jgi:hypothetical protein
MKAGFRPECLAFSFVFMPQQLAQLTQNLIQARDFGLALSIDFAEPRPRRRIIGLIQTNRRFEIVLDRGEGFAQFVNECDAGLPQVATPLAGRALFIFPHLAGHQHWHFFSETS